MPYADPLLRREKARIYTQRLREKYGSAPEGICSLYPSCKNPTDGVHKKCLSCREYLRDYKKGIKRARSGNRRCTKCGEPTGSTGTRCAVCKVDRKNHPHKEKYKRRGAAYEVESWAVVLDHYVAICACCGEKEPLFLTIDHVNGERYGSGRRRGAELCAWLVQNNFPEGFRILCFNCNGSLGFRGYCPHGDLKQERHAGRPTERVLTADEREALRRRWERLKRGALDAYGGAICACCGETAIEFLSLDHVDCNGADHRRAVSGKSTGGSSALYCRLKTQGYPQNLNLRVLCMNCNAGRQRAPGKICPHVTTRWGPG